MKSKLTEPYVKKLAVPAKMTIVWDSDVSQFGIRLSPTGSKTFIKDYRHHRRQRRYTIGDYPVWSVNAAREEAKKIERQVDAGIDPLGVKQTNQNAPTMANLWDYIETHHLPQLRPHTQADYKSMLKKWLRPRFTHQKVAEVTFADIQGFHVEVSKLHPVRANRLLELLGVAFRLAEHQEWISKSPTAGVKANKEHSKEIFLTPAQFATLYQLLEADSNNQSARVVWLLILTGARKGEMLGAEWKDFDLEVGLWTKPHHKTKQAREHRYTLSKPAVALLKNLHEKRTSDFVFPGDKPGTHQGDIKGYFKNLLIRAKIPHVRIHDLRHSYASLAVSSGVEIYTLSHLMGHSDIKSTQRYAKLYDDKLREASDSIGSKLGLQDGK